MRVMQHSMQLLYGFEYQNRFRYGYFSSFISLLDNVEGFIIVLLLRYACIKKYWNLRVVKVGQLVLCVFFSLLLFLAVL